MYEFKDASNEMVMQNIDNRQTGDSMVFEEITKGYSKKVDAM